jgi:RND family efflux transporter MFP subunit
MNAEHRTPKAERNPKTEIRKVSNRRPRIRASVFGFHSAFGFRSSAFPLPLFFTAAALLLAGCGKKTHERAPVPALPPAIVQVETVEAKRLMATEEVIGTVRAKTRAMISANMSGRIEEMFAASGQTVQRGDLLMRLDAREVQARLDRVTAERDQVEKEYQRFTSLLDQNAVTRQEFEAVESRQRVAKAAVNEADTMLGYAQLTAPFDAIITRKLAEVGDLAFPGKPLLELEDPAALRLEAAVPEALLGRVRLGAKLAVRIPAMEQNLEGVVSEIEPAGDPDSRTFLVKIDLPEADGLRSGQFGRVAVPVAETSVLRVPASAVIQRGQLEMVFIAANQQAQMRIVRTGKHFGSEIEVISGVTAGEQIVTEGNKLLLDGQPLEMK